MNKKDALLEAISSADDIKKELVTIPEWSTPSMPEGIQIEMRTMTGPEWVNVTRLATVKGEDGTYTIDYRSIAADVIIASAFVPGTDEKLFDDIPEHHKLIEGKGAPAIDRLVMQALDLAGMSTKAQEDLKNGSPVAE